MKQSWLFFAIAVWGAIVLESVVLCILIFCIMAFFHLCHFSKGHLLFVVLLGLALFRIQPRTTDMPISTTVVVSEIKSSYVVGSCDGQKVLVYGCENVSLSDVIKIKGSFTQIDGVHNPPEFYFPEWCKRRSIYYGIQADDYEVIEEGSGAAHDLYSYVQRLPDDRKKIINEILYGIHEDDVSYMVTSSGMHIVTFWQVIRSILSLFFTSSTLEIVFLGWGCMPILPCFLPPCFVF